LLSEGLVFELVVFGSEGLDAGNELGSGVVSVFEELLDGWWLGRVLKEKLVDSMAIRIILIFTILLLIIIFPDFPCPNILNLFPYLFLQTLPHHPFHPSKIHQLIQLLNLIVPHHFFITHTFHFPQLYSLKQLSNIPFFIH
jgi:hypothetical protein